MNFRPLTVRLGTNKLNNNIKYGAVKDLNQP